MGPLMSMPPMLSPALHSDRGPSPHHQGDARDAWARALGNAEAYGGAGPSAPKPRAVPGALACPPRFVVAPAACGRKPEEILPGGDESLVLDRTATPTLPVRVHAEESPDGVRVWIGVDRALLAKAPFISAEVQRSIAQRGVRILSLTCNGQPIANTTESKEPPWPSAL